MLFFLKLECQQNFIIYHLLRFAKIQITSWGHPITSANESIDYFISSDLLKGDHDNEMFSEKIIYLKNLPMYFYKPKIKKTLNNEDYNKKYIFLFSEHD